MRNLALFTFFLLTPALWGQVIPSSVSPNTTTGVQPYETYDGVRENISLSNGNLNIYVPILTLPQRAGRSFELGVEADSKTWSFVQDVGSVFSFTSWQQDLRLPMITPNLRLSVPTLQGTFGVDAATGEDCLMNWIFTSADGSKHTFQNRIGCSGTGAATTTIADSDDSSFIRLDLSNDSDAVVRLKDGTAIHFLGTTGAYSQSFDTIIDTNGNVITATKSNGVLTSITDSVGRVISVNLSSGTIGYKDANGTQRTVVFTSVAPLTTGGPITFVHPLQGDCSFPPSTTHSQSFTVGTGNTAFTMTIPNGAAGRTYRFDFDAAGEVLRVTYPGGGYTAYDHAADEATWSNNKGSCTAVDFREITAKHECRQTNGSCSSTDTTTYQATLGGYSNKYMNVLYPDPSGTPNKTHYVFSVPTYPEYTSRETDRYIYSGSSTLLRTTHTDYTNSGVSLCDCSLPIRTTTTLNDVSPAMVSKVETDYPIVPSTFYNQDCPIFFNNPNTCYIDTPTEVREFGYSGSIQRRTDNTWLSSEPYSNDQEHILDLKLTSTIYDSSSATCLGQSRACAKTTYEYDNYTMGLSTSGATQHQSVAVNRGNVTAVERWLNTTGATLTTRYQYDDAGNSTLRTDPLGNNTSYFFADSFRQTSCIPASGSAAGYITKITNAASQSKIFTYDSCLGSLATYKDENNQLTTYQSDSFGRRTSASYPDSGQTTWTFNDVAPTSITESRLMGPGQNLVTVEDHDGFERVAQTQLDAPEGVIYVATSYDSLGRKASVSNAHLSASGPTDGTTSYTYDALDRSVKVTDADGSSSHTAYCGNGTLSTDEASKWRRTVTDALGRLIETDEPSSPTSTATACAASGANTTTYGYDALEDLTSVLQVGSRSRSFTYDSLARLLTLANPETGTETLTYDNDDNLITKKDARGITITYSWDNLNRLKGKTYSDSTPPVSYLYDVTMTNGVSISNPVGRLVKAGTASDSEGVVNTYDSIGRVLGQWQWPPQTSNGDASFMAYTYDKIGDMLTYTNGEGVTFTQHFDSAGRVATLTSSLSDAQHPPTLATLNQYSPSGDPELLTLGNAVREVHLFNKRFQPCRLNLNITAENSVTYSLCTDNLQYNTINDWLVQYNEGSADNGNAVHFESNYGQVFNRTYTFDQVNRISTMTETATGQACKGLSWGYDAWGNRLTQTPTSGSCGSSQLAYAATNHISTSGYTYDAAGNLTHDASHSYTYDAEDRVTEVDGGGTGTYVYDAKGRRVQKTTGGVTTTYLYDLEDRVISEQTASGWTNGYMYLQGNLFAEYSGGTTNFVQRDHLGSTRVLTGVNQAVTQFLDYGAFGERTVAAGNITHEYTGKERDSETNNDDFGARYYSSAIGRFMSPDWSQKEQPVPYAKVDNPQTLNLYGYVENNPVSRIDADGHCVEDACLVEGATAAGAGLYVLGAGVAAGTAAYFNTPSGQRSLDTFTSAAGASITSSVQSIKNTVSGWFSKNSAPPPSSDKPGTKGKPDHQQTAAEEAKAIGGEREVRIPTPGGNKETRVGDAVAKDANGKVTAVTQVIRPTPAGNVPLREQKAAEDIQKATGVTPNLVPVRPLPPFLF